jgi:uncharacterized Fe-S cluster-containing radical SAM superfamily protein
MWLDIQQIVQLTNKSHNTIRKYIKGLDEKDIKKIKMSNGAFKIVVKKKALDNLVSGKITSGKSEKQTELDSEMVSYLKEQIEELKREHKEQILELKKEHKEQIENNKIMYLGALEKVQSMQERKLLVVNTEEEKKERRKWYKLWLK